MKCEFCINYRLNPEIGGVCSITNKKTTFAESCPDYAINNKMIEVEKKTINSQMINEPFIFSDILKGILFKLPSNGTSSVLEIKKSKITLFTSLAFSMICLFIGIGLFFYGLQSLDIELKKSGLTIAMVGVIGLLLLLILYKRNTFSNESILVLTKKGIVINGTPIKWDEFLGFNLENQGDEQRRLYVLKFHTTKEISNDIIYLSDINFSISQLRKIIENYKDK